jgi:23S rRNA (cytidine1920-2'-O)/16S rRNA (cytidine1409-2'-O)-methyltransferase
MSRSSEKKRLDLILVDRGLVISRERAQALILAGDVLVDDTPCTKSGTAFPIDAEIRLRKPDHPYVSRGALKLERALEEFKLDVSGQVAMDIGASTGGFTQILLLRGAIKVFALDVGHNQMDWSIRSDARVVCLEKVNARSLEYSLIGQKVDIIVVDVSFISLRLVFPALIQFMHPRTELVTLIKPQFEAGRDEVGKGGIVQSEEVHTQVVKTVTEAARDLGLIRQSLINSPIKGTDGNREFLAHWRLV